MGCYQWNPSWSEVVTKKKKQATADLGSYILTHLPDSGGYLDQDAYTMSMIEFIKDEFTELRKFRG